MSDFSTNLSLPYIQPSQAQKHVTHNEGMRRLDALVQLMVLASDQTTPPPSPDDGDRYILPTGATGDWAGQDQKIAAYEDNTWVFFAPNSGWVAWVDTPGEQRIFDGTGWVLAADAIEFQNLDFVGVATTADATNRLSVASDATLFSHAGAGHQMKLNKAGSADTASLLFQTAWSGRAEMGTIGSDNFEIKVSDDGSTFNQAMLVDGATGTVQFPSGVTGLAPAEFGDGALLTTDYSASKGVDLVTNSTGLLGNNYNYPSQLVYDATITPNLPASFSFAGHHPGLIQMDELLPVDPNQVYKLASYIRQEGLAGDWSAYTNEERHRHYMGLISLDADMQPILARHHMRYKHGGTDSLTTLAAPLSPGDATISLLDASGWNESNNASHNKGITVFGYNSAAGFSYDYYSRITEYNLFDLGQVDKTTNIVTLNQPLPSSMGNPDDAGGTWPIGTKIANASSGSAYKYAFYSSIVVPAADQWYRTNGYIGGIDTSGQNNGFNFPPGTAFVKPFWLPNYTNRASGYAGYPNTGISHKVWYTGASVVPQPLAVMSETLSGLHQGSKEIKVPVSDFATDTMSLAPAAISMSEV